MVHRRSRAQIPAGRRGLERQRPQRLPGRKCRTRGRRLLAVRPGEVHPVHLRLLSGAGALAGQSDLLPRRGPAVAAVDSAAAGQGPQRRPVLPRLSRRRVLPAAWRRSRRFWRELDRRPAVRLRRQHRRWRPEARGCRRDDGRDRTAAVAARQADRAAQHGDFLAALAADLAARPDPGVGPAGLDRFCAHGRDRLAACCSSSAAAFAPAGAR